jgi:crotonobetainyl-CoA:carnitine CoA-transferase CaiB-like acyl-CoA transferase
MPRPPVHFSDYEQRDYVPTGRIGEDTDRVFMAMGYTEEEISQLRDKKTIL